MTKVEYSGPCVETGPVQFGDDWLGLFIRGDRCIELRNVLQTALDQMAMPDKLHELQIVSYLRLIDEVLDVNTG